MLSERGFCCKMRYDPKPVDAQSRIAAGDKETVLQATPIWFIRALQISAQRR